MHWLRGMTQDEKEETLRQLQEQLDNIGKLEEQFAAAEKAAGLDPAPDISWHGRLARLRERLLSR
jgi:hypothetical protein